jgi:dTDP-4-amino-4,6-dideoxygalactose transaminase
MAYRIPFNKPFIAGRELYHIAQAVLSENLSGDGVYTRRVQEFLETRFGVHKALLTHSCTGALELSADLLDLRPGDEVIVPSFTFVSTVNAIARRGATPVFLDVREDTLNLDERLVEAAVTPRTRAIWAVHYAGVACQMDAIGDVARKHRLRVVEDAAQGVNATWRGRALGSLGDVGCYSFHETKNFISGQGGAICVNDPELVQRAEIFRHRGTNRSQFLRGQVDKYTWVELGSSYQAGELIAAFLWGQLEAMEAITERRRAIHARYHEAMEPLERKGRLRRPVVPQGCGINYHLYYLLLRDGADRDALIAHLKDRGICAVFHYVPLHAAPKGLEIVGRRIELPVTESVSERLVRLPMYFDLTPEDQFAVIEAVHEYARLRP